jgi:predicted  nucleic acid-binding Zn-ribbon protein
MIISSYVALPQAEAEVFDIGEKVSESGKEGPNWDCKWYYFDTECMVFTHPDFINHTNSIFDGNRSTGIDHDFGTGLLIFFVVIFPEPIYVTNITFYNYFNGSASNYSIDLYTGRWVMEPFNKLNRTSTFHFNGLLHGFRFDPHFTSDGIQQINFNDVIINYTKRPTDLDEISNSIDEINKKINDFYDMINITNNSQGQVRENITAIWSEFDKLNRSINNMSISIENLNNSFYENITQINNDLTTLEKELYDINLNISNLSSNVSKISKLRESIDQLFLDVKNINENITDIKNNMPDEYNDTFLKNRIFKLEANNTDLNDKIKNLTSEFESEKAELNKKIDEMNSTINDLKGSGKDVQGKEQQFDYSVLALILVIIIIVIHILTTVLFRRSDLNDKGLMPEPNILNEVITDILKREDGTNKDLSNEEIKRKLDEKYQSGEISKNAYDYCLRHYNSQNSLNNIPQDENTK